MWSSVLYSQLVYRGMYLVVLPRGTLIEWPICFQLINGFSTQSDAEMRGKTLHRLNDITCLYKTIETILAGMTFNCHIQLPNNRSVN